MDETAMAFSIPSTTTIKEKGTKTISILSTGHRYSNFTVVLVCLADIKETWEAIDINMIGKFFKYCGITNTIDKKNDLIFNFTRIINQTNPEREIESQKELNNSENDSKDD
ncbi:15932_t:CDS:2, partial [Dentiscutata erythropus]